MHSDRDTTNGVSMERNIGFGEMATCGNEEHSDCHQPSNISSGDLGLVEEESSGDSDELLAEKQDIIRALLKGLMLVEQMEGSITDFEDVLTFSKELYCKNDERCYVTVDTKIQENYTFV